MTNMLNIDITAKLSNNINSLLMDLTDDFEQRLLKKCHSRGHTKIRLSHTSLFSHLGYKSQRLTTLAEHAGITQQAMGKLVKELVKEGYLQRHVDKVDKRAKIIEPTALGKLLVSDSLEILEEISAEYADAMGPDGLNELEFILKKATKALNTKHRGEQL